MTQVSIIGDIMKVISGVIRQGYGSNHPQLPSSFERDSLDFDLDTNLIQFMTPLL
jgi:hypothetical protein